jgi:hypothetical protein
MAERKRDKGTVYGSTGGQSAIVDPFTSQPGIHTQPGIQTQPSFHPSPSLGAQASSSGSTTTKTGRPTQVKLPEEVVPGWGSEEESFASCRSSNTQPADLLGLRTSLDNLNVADSPALPGTPSAIRGLGEEEEPHTPPERILREGRQREAPGAPRKPRRPFGYDKESIARVTKKLDFD